MLFRTLAVSAAVSLWALSAQAKTCDVTIEGNDAMQFNTKELSVAKDCKDVNVTLKHTGKLPKSAMGHNWVLVSEQDSAAVLGDAMKAGVANDYLPKGDARVIAATKLIGGGETATTTFKTAALKAGQIYKFFCTFPGHSGLMTGTFAVK